IAVVGRSLALQEESPSMSIPLLPTGSYEQAPQHASTSLVVAPPRTPATTSRDLRDVLLPRSRRAKVAFAHERVAGTRFPHFFAPERAFATNNFAEALDAWEADFRPEHTQLVLNEIEVDEELNLAFRGQEYQQTESAIEQWCKILGIPLSFAHRLPQE